MIQDGPIELAYIPSLLVQSPLPVRDPKATVFVRKAGNQELSLTSKIGIPFGHIGRLTFALAVTDALRNHSNRVELGTVSAWLRRLDQQARGGERGSSTLVQNQFHRIGNTMISISGQRSVEEGTEKKQRNYIIADDLELFWGNRKVLSDVPTLFENYILFSPKFFEYVVNHAVPVDLSIYDNFQAPLAQDIYAWLAWKLHNLEEPLMLRWDQLEAQFADKKPGNRRDWRKRWLQAAVEVIATGYSEARVLGSQEGIILHPSPRAIKVKETGFLF